MLIADALNTFAFFGPFWGAVTLISVVAMGTSYYLKKRTKQCAFDLAMEAFRRGAQTHEVEKLLRAFDQQELVEAAELAETDEDDAVQKTTTAGKGGPSPAGVYVN